MATDTLTISSLSTVYVCFPVATQANGAAVDPTADVVEFAFLTTSANPTAPDWVTGSWEDLGGAYLARCLVGPGAEVLAAGTYYVWLKVTDSPEAPVEPLGPVLIVV
jgi:hypothetical protein